MAYKPVSTQRNRLYACVGHIGTGRALAPAFAIICAVEVIRTLLLTPNNDALSFYSVLDTPEGASNSRKTKALVIPPANRTICGACQEWEHDYLLELFQARKCQKLCDPSSVAVVAVTGIETDLLPKSTRQALPRILVHRSDENCDQELTWGQYYHKFELVLRQYACFGFYERLYEQYPHVRTIPLGYGQGMFPGPQRRTIRTSRQVIESLEQQMDHNKTSETERRPLAWSFVGKIKSNRRDMVNTFSNVKPHKTGNHLSRKTMGEIYQKSDFVLSGRGWSNLDCFRHYEASIMGAIPVLQNANDTELNNTFSHFIGSSNAIPSHWIIGSTWEDAKRQVLQLYANPEELAERRRDGWRWWKSQLDAVEAAVIHQRKEFSHWNFDRKWS